MDTSAKPICKYGTNCYRKNARHLEEFSHGPTNKARAGPDEKMSPPAKKRPSEDPMPPNKKAKISDFFQGNAASTAQEAGDAAVDTKRKIHEASKTSSAKDAAVEAKREEPEDFCTDEELVQAAENVSCPAEKEHVGVAENGTEEVVKKHPEISAEDLSALSNTEVNAIIKEKFLVEMPEDFFKLWEFAQSENAKNPTDAFFPILGLQLVGPYDIISGKYRSGEKSANYLLHWRYYYDPPEFQTVIRGGNSSQFHLGYFRDDPSEMPVFVASNSAAENCNISPRGENIFAALSSYIDERIKKDAIRKGALQGLKGRLVGAASKYGLPLVGKTPAMKAREKKVNSRTLHGAGMVVPVDRNEVGYRELPESPGELKKILKKIAGASTEAERNAAYDPLMETLMCVQFANDECDYGQGLELGLDLFSYGADCLKKDVLNLLTIAYQLLRRPAYELTIEAHMASRSKGHDLSQL